MLFGWLATEFFFGSRAGLRRAASGKLGSMDIASVPGGEVGGGGAAAGQRLKASSKRAIKAGCFPAYAARTPAHVNTVPYGT